MEKVLFPHIADNSYRAERVFAEAEENGNHYYYVKWENLPYAEATWELEDIVKTRFNEQVSRVFFSLEIYRQPFLFLHDFLCVYLLNW